jgi:hypothetical protein
LRIEGEGGSAGAEEEGEAGEGEADGGAGGGGSGAGEEGLEELKVEGGAQEGEEGNDGTEARQEARGSLERLWAWELILVGHLLALRGPQTGSQMMRVEV